MCTLMHPSFCSLKLSKPCKEAACCCCTSPSLVKALVRSAMAPVVAPVRDVSAFCQKRCKTGEIAQCHSWSFSGHEKIFSILGRRSHVVLGLASHPFSNVLTSHFSNMPDVSDPSNAFSNISLIWLDGGATSATIHIGLLAHTFLII